MKIMRLYKLLAFIFCAMILGACGGGGGGNTATNPDTLPDAFSFTDQTNVTLSTVIVSNSITVAGIDAAAAISIADGEYSIDSSTFTNAAGTVTNGQTVTVRHTSSSLFTTLTSTLLSIGDVSANFNSTTGPIGTGFNKSRGFNGTVLSISPATDSSGDVYVGGDFTTYNGTGSNAVIRLNSDGTVETAFAVGSGFEGGAGFIDAVFSISPANDGSGDVYLGGGFSGYNGSTSNRVIRLNGDGTVDAAFAVGDSFDQYVESVSVATDGSGDVYVGGGFSTYNGTASNGVIRLNSDGTVDAGFVVGGGFDLNIFVISPATDGSNDVFIGGRFSSYQSTVVDQIVRLNPDGSLN